MAGLATIDDYRTRAREQGSVASVIEIEHDPVSRTSLANANAFDDVALRPRILVNVSDRDLSATVLGTDVSLPVLVAPSGLHQKFHPEGEVATTRAAGSAGTIMILSTLSSRSMEEVAEASSGPRWFQLYVLKDRGLSAELVERAEASGYSAIVLTVDNLGKGSVPESLLSKESGEPVNHWGNFEGLGSDRLPHPWNEHLEDGLTWDDIEWLKRTTDLPIVIKGIQTPDDALLAQQAGVAGIVVSNHGGFALQGAPPPISILADVVKRVGGNAGMEVYLDSGVRRGTDVLKALALGARAVLVGRPVIWGLMVGGESGAAGVLAILRSELNDAMGCSGIRKLADATQDLVHLYPRRDLS